jgi:hypothetical protein
MLTDFKIQLRRQLGFLRRSAESYDRGYHDEAVRLATTIRVLLHDTKASTSLLSLLGVKSSINLLTTVSTDPLHAGTCMFDGLTMMSLRGIEPSFSKSGQFVSVADWWEQVVLVTGPKVWITRRLLVLGAANKDGGAHVDPHLNHEYQQLMDGMWTFVRRQGPFETSIQLTDHHFVAIRQLVHELLHSPDLMASAGQ